MIYDRWDQRSYLVRLGDATSQWFNVAFGNGMPDESVSGRAFRNTTLRKAAGFHVSRRWRLLRRVADALFFWQDDHSEWAFWEDIYRSRARGRAADRFDIAATLHAAGLEPSLAGEQLIAED